MQFHRQVSEPASSDPGFGDPFGSALCVDKDDLLSGLGTFQTDRGIVPAMFTLSGVNYSNATADLNPKNYSLTADKGWPTRKGTNLQQTFQLSAVGFKNFIFVVSLVYGADNRSLTYLVY